MPYTWQNTTQGKRLTLRPHRSLPIRGFAAVFLTAFIFAMLPLFGLIGTLLLWGMLPFVLVTLGGLYFAFMHTYRTGDAEEELTIGPDETRLSVTDRGEGIPEQEHTVFGDGEERPTSHAGGVGLWLVRWTVERIGGQIAYSDGDRTTVELFFSTADRDPDLDR